MALNNEFKVKNNLNTLGKILSSGTDIFQIFTTNTAFNAASSLLTPLTLTNTLTGLLVLNTDFSTYRTSVATSTATLLPTTTYQQTSGGFALSGYNTTIADSVSSIASPVIPILPASVWKTQTIVQVLDSILFPDVLPTYTIPTLTISFTSGLTNNATYEVGTLVTPILNTVGIKNDAGRYTSIEFLRNTSTSLSTVTNPTSGSTSEIPGQFGYSNLNNPNATYTLSYTDSYSLPTPQAVTWNTRANINAGVAKQNNKGVFDTRAAGATTNTPQAARTNFASSSLTVNSQYIRWVGSVSSLFAQTSSYRTAAGLTSSFDTTSLPTPTNIAGAGIGPITNNNIVVLLPASKMLRKVVTASFETIYDIADTATTSTWVSSNVTVPDAGNTYRNYKLYTKTSVDPLNANLTEVTISNA